jgi:hypothetical protein
MVAPQSFTPGALEPRQDLYRYSSGVPDDVTIWSCQSTLGCVGLSTVPFISFLVSFWHSNRSLFSRLAWFKKETRPLLFPTKDAALSPAIMASLPCVVGCSSIDSYLDRHRSALEPHQF